MKKHGAFELWLHDNDELSAMQGMAAISRHTLQEWPLSVVERVNFEGGVSRIYKAFHNPPVETEFYRRARSRHIPEVFYNHSEGERHWLLLEDVPGEHPANLSWDEMLQLVRRAREIVCGMGSFEPYRYNLSADHYNSFADAVIGLLRKLHAEEKLRKTDGEAIARMEVALSHPEVLRAVRGPCALLHGDLHCNNLLIRPDGELVILDWQSILFGPEEIDIYNLLAGRGIGPVSIAGIGPEVLRLALSIQWLADCADR
ncbi:MAG: aminoglycoside phosphotransferase family protein [Oscillospiraceae bacterium]|jgi:hypothetical protein|nr:aminoglycoside phosphotransferase family protein [Oscillospiraceae bacterium]